MKYVYSCLVLLLLSTACKDDDAVDLSIYQLGDPFELKVGDIVMGEEIFGPFSAPAVYLESVVENRCPCGSICAVSGYVTARLNVNGNPLDVVKGDFVRGRGFPKTSDGYIYTLQAVAPCPEGSVYDIPQEDYVIELIVEKL